MGVCVATSQPKLYRPRRPRESPLWRCLDGHFYDFVQDYPDKYEPIYGFFRPVVEEVVNKFIDCGDLRKGFATARCGECGEEFLVAFSCKTRYLCPSCHQKKVLLFGDFIVNEVAFPVPHRQYVTQHIPNKNAQMILYYGWYSNRARGTRRIAQGTKHEDCDGIEIIDVSNYTPKKSMGKKWRALIAKVYEDPLICPRCGSLMFIKSLTEDPFEIKKALQELGLWDKLVNTLAIPRAPPETETSTLTLDLTESQVPLCEIIAE
jgi:DNA-directed RNA polymerase subunit RPC12/RpoP